MPSDKKPIKTPKKELHKDFNIEMGEQTRFELSEAEKEFLRVLDDEMEQKKSKPSPKNS